MTETQGRKLEKAQTMKEKIGKVTLDYEFYPGKDLYSDGKVEEELLEISENYREDEWNHEIARRKSWPVLYHFSHIRGNIVDWLPVTREDTVLEIGSGCGAVTGVLAKKAKKVTCIELSKMRSTINANRNRDLDNIEILVGNFDSIEKSLDEKFDYVTLIGVFEYSEGYMGTDTPYTDMLKKVSRFLKPDGKLIIAIENRLGLKYWAGCTEDHVGKFFEGLEGYPDTTGVRTFSRKEIGEIFDQAGGYQYQMYYPYPDYKFPMSIYSDRWLPRKGELREIHYNFDRARLRLFDEIQVADSLIGNDLYPDFSNSFLIVASLKDGKLWEDSPLYVKFSNERDDAYSLRTEIHENSQGMKSVIKVPCSRKGSAHTSRIYDLYEKLEKLYQGSGIHMNRCDKLEQGVRLEYLQGETLEQELDRLVSAKEYEKVWEKFSQYIDILRKAAGEQEFAMTDSFRRIFGDVKLPEGLKCAPVTDIDPVCANLLKTGEEWQLLDYEWSFDFPVPVDYQIYRVLKYYLYTSTARCPLLELDFYKRAGITEEEQKIFEKMEENFQQFILGTKVPMRHMYQDISQGTILDVRNLAREVKAIQIYADRGADFSEEDSWFLPKNENRFEGMIQTRGKVKRLRIDPCEESCLVRIHSLKYADGTEVVYGCNGKPAGEGLFYFEGSDPYFVTEELRDGTEELFLSAEIQCLGKQEKNLTSEVVADVDKLRQDVENLHRAMEELEAEKIRYEARIRDMEGTKVWKAYRTVKKGIERK